MTWEPTRAAALARLHDFLPRAGHAYAAHRNVDRGPDDRSNVSALSPYIRRRMITEEEVIAAVLRRHSFAAAEKFVQEVVWRSYWKGWLEMRPSIWLRYQAELAALNAQCASDPPRADALVAATHGRTGLDCFDAWAQELLTTGWLHNHTRMWFASIWIFTLRLPWQLGADFFYRNLLDADPASNTLSWRWVAGLHTQGKHYLARRDNIVRNTMGRFDPGTMLNESAAPLVEDTALPAPAPLAPAAAHADGAVALLLSEDDLHPESWAVTGTVRAIAVLARASGGAQDAPAARFAEGALTDAAARAAAHFGVDARIITADAHGPAQADGFARMLADWARASGADSIVTGYAPAGEVAALIDAMAPALRATGMPLVQLRRAWDSRAWPHARAGFFKLKVKIPALVAHLA